MKKILVAIIAIVGYIVAISLLEKKISPPFPLKFSFILCATIGGLFLLSHFFSIKRAKASGAIQIIDTACISPGKFIQVVLVADKVLVLGVTSQSINLLTEIENKEIIEKIKEERIKKSNFFEEFQKFYKKDLRRHIERIQNI